MRISCLLVAAALTACGVDEPAKTVVVKDAGTDAAKAMQYERDAGHDAGHDSGKPAAQGGMSGMAAASGGKGGITGSLPVDAGEMVAGGTGGGPDPRPEGGQGGSAPVGGSPAPAERVLWSQEWTIEVHSPAAYGAMEGDTMGLVLDAGPLCVFGLMGAASGTSQTYETDGMCITKFSAPAGTAAFFAASDGDASGNLGRTALVGWKEAVTGHTVKYLRRTQTYTTQLLGSDAMRWTYADFSGKWEAVGF